MEYIIPVQATIDIGNVSPVQATIDIGNVSIDSTIEDGTPVITYPDYTGDYQVTSFLPAMDLITTSRVLQTNDKHMTDNVTIYSLPTTETPNAQGGMTIKIGE